MSMTATDRKPFNPRRRLTADERRRLLQTMRLQDGAAVKQSGSYMLAYHDAMIGRAVDRACDDAKPEPPRGVSSWMIALVAVAVLGVLAMVYFAFVVPR